MMEVGEASTTAHLRAVVAKDRALTRDQPAIAGDSVKPGVERKRK